MKLYNIQNNLEFRNNKSILNLNIKKLSAQVWSMDFIASVIVFFSVVVLVIFAWNYTVGQNQEQLSFNAIENTALSASDTLLRTPGLPEDWTEVNVVTLGLASMDNVLNTTKVGRFLNLADDKVKTLLGISNFEFYFELRYLNSSVIPWNSTQNITKGTYPTQNSKIIIPVERYVLYNNLPSKMGFLLWKT